MTKKSGRDTIRIPKDYKMKDYHKNSTSARIYLGDYRFLRELARKLDCSIADALHLILTEPLSQEKSSALSRSQISMSTLQPSIKSIVKYSDDGGVTKIIESNFDKIIKPKGGHQWMN